MPAHFEGERLIIAATLDAVETGQEFERIPPHMTIVPWFQLQESYQSKLTDMMHRFFTHKDLYQKLVGGEVDMFGEDSDRPVRQIIGAETGPSFALRAFVKSMGTFRDGDKFADTFSPYITDEPLRKIYQNEKLALPTVALISAHYDKPLQHVVEAFTLGIKAQRG